MNDQPKTCSICLTTLTKGRHCSAKPINNDRCCWDCDELIVSPVRVARATGKNIVAAIATALAMHARKNELRQEAK